MSDGFRVGMVDLYVNVVCSFVFQNVVFLGRDPGRTRLRRPFQFRVGGVGVSSWRHRSFGLGGEPFRVRFNRPLQFRVGCPAGGAAFVGDAVDVGAAAAALLDFQLAGGDQAGAQLTHPLRGDVEAMRQAVDTELEGLPGMPIDVQGDVRQRWWAVPRTLA